MAQIADVLDVTEGAAGRVRVMADREGRPDPILRVRVVAGGCDGFSYRLSLEDAPAPDDLVIDRFGVRVLVDPRSAPLLRGSTLDFSDALLGGGLKVRNPNAAHECACGESFSV
ncbi:MAG TPA: iron-sulfur cluster assembly accessory protein [Actinomycetota bacterium]|nr:iron-sulfur cluster assembly accessory protein [Actinomycetota bacterium]